MPVVALGSCSQSQPVGHWLVAVHGVFVAWQCDVCDVQVQLGGKGAIASAEPPGAGGGVVLPDPEGAGGELDGESPPADGAGPASMAEPPAQAHSSGTHVKPSPHAASFVQGSTYFGTHALTVFDVQVSAGVAQFESGGQEGWFETGQAVSVCE